MRKINMIGCRRLRPISSADEVRGVISRLGLEQPDHRHCRLLRARRERQCRRGCQTCDELPPPHRSSLLPLSSERIPAEDAWERATTLKRNDAECRFLFASIRPVE
jgi:hypothetical protein